MRRLSGCVVAAFFIVALLPAHLAYAAANPVTVVDTGDTGGLLDVQMIGSRIWTVGWVSILRSTNGGRSWEAQATPDDRGGLQVSFSTRTHGWVAPASGWNELLVTNDGGSAWDLMPCPLDGAAYGLDFVDDSEGWAIGSYGRLGHTGDGGQTWDRRDIGPAIAAETLRAVDFADSLHGCVVGEGNVDADLIEAGIFTTSDGGQSWEQTYSSVWTWRNQLTDICMVSPDEGWAVGYHWPHVPLVLRTSDGGTTWAEHPLPVPDPCAMYLSGVDFVDTKSGFIVGTDIYSALTGYLFRTRDGGLTWETYMANGVDLERVDCTSATEAACAGFDYGTHKGVVVLFSSPARGKRR